jgi:hypothetical protein
VCVVSTKAYPIYSCHELFSLHVLSTGGSVGQANGKFAIKIRSCRAMIVPMTTHPDNEISPNYSQVPCMIDPWTPVVRARSHKC